MELQRKEIRLPLGACVGPDQRPLYGYSDPIPADCAGGLALHKALKGSRWKWMVTHEASGLSLDIIGAMTKARALDHMQQALALPFDWTGGAAQTIQALKESRGIVDAMRRIGTHDN